MLNVAPGAPAEANHVADFPETEQWYSWVVVNHRSPYPQTVVWFLFSQYLQWLMFSAAFSGAIGASSALLQN